MIMIKLQSEKLNYDRSRVRTRDLKHIDLFSYKNTCLLFIRKTISDMFEKWSNFLAQQFSFCIRED